MRVSGDQSSLTAEAYSVVRRRILHGELALGQSLSRRKLAAELGMSFLPVTEALLRLECEGLLESRPRAGTRVPIPSPENVMGQFVVREALEVQAAVLFTTAASNRERGELRKLAARVDTLSAQSDRVLYVEVHQAFHFRIAEGAQCQALRDAIERTHALASTWFCAMKASPSRESPTRHKDLAETITNGDAEAAAKAVREHLAFGRQHAMQVLEPYFLVRSTTDKHYSRSDAPIIPVVN